MFRAGDMPGFAMMYVCEFVSLFFGSPVGHITLTIYQLWVLSCAHCISQAINLGA